MIWQFRDRLAQAGAGHQVFQQIPQQLYSQGYLARCGQTVDATLIQAPTQRDKREEAETIKQGAISLGSKQHKRAQKYVDLK